jgi:SAM-dependent methyltransferase
MANRRSGEDATERLHRFVSGFHATNYVYTGVACGLFEVLTEPRTPGSLAADRDLHEPYVRRFCEVGLRWGILETDAMTPDAEDGSTRFQLDERFLEALAFPESPRYMGDFFRFLGAHQCADYASYPRAFEAGNRRRPESRGPEFTEVIEGSTRGLQDLFLTRLLSDLPALESRLERGDRLLDVGCGTGGLVCRLCTQFPAVEAVGVDLDGDAIDLARKRADREGLADRTDFREQDATTVDGPFTVAVFFMSVHEIDPDERRRLFDRLGDVLTDDGVIVVFDEVYPERSDQFERRPFTAGIETQWAELTWGADVPTDGEHRGLLAAADCHEVDRRTVANRFVVYQGVKT